MCNITSLSVAHAVIVLSHTIALCMNTLLRTAHNWVENHHVYPEPLKTRNNNCNHLLIYTCEAGKDSQNRRMVRGGRDLWRSPSPIPLPRQGHLKQVTQDSAKVFASTVNMQVSTFQFQSTAEVAEANWYIWTILSLRLFENFDAWLVVVFVLGWRGSCIFWQECGYPKNHLKFQQFLSLKLWNIN